MQYSFLNICLVPASWINPNLFFFLNLGMSVRKPSWLSTLVWLHVKAWKYHWISLLEERFWKEAMHTTVKSAKKRYWFLIFVKEDSCAVWCFLSITWSWKPCLDVAHSCCIEDKRFNASKSWKKTKNLRDGRMVKFCVMHWDVSQSSYGHLWLPMAGFSLWISRRMLQMAWGVR